MLFAHCVVRCFCVHRRTVPQRRGIPRDREQLDYWAAETKTLLDITETVCREHIEYLKKTEKGGEQACRSLCPCSPCSSSLRCRKGCRKGATARPFGEVRTYPPGLGRAVPLSLTIPVGPRHGRSGIFGHARRRSVWAFEYLWTYRLGDTSALVVSSTWPPGVGMALGVSPDIPARPYGVVHFV